MALDWMQHLFLIPPLSVAVALFALVASLAAKSWGSCSSKEKPRRNDFLFPEENQVDGAAKDDSVDCIVVGAGIAGAALAYALGKDGRNVLVIERDCSTPDRIVGELLQPGGYLKLVELGLKECLDGIEAQKVKGYALFMDGLDAKVKYPLEGHSEDIAGRSFHHGRFIANLRLKANSLQTVQLIEGSVLSLIEEDGVVKGVRYRTKKDNVVEEFNAFAPITFVCDGYSSNLRKNLCTPKVDVPSHFVGLILENCELPYSNFGHVILADPSPILFYPISNTEIRCLVDCPKEIMMSVRSGKMTEYLTTRIAPQLPEQLQKAFIAAASDSAKIRSMENKIMPAVPKPKPGALLLGDAFNMRHPLTGGGMTVALSDIVVLRDMLKPLKSFQDQSAVCKYLQAFYTRRKPVASTINTLAGALYRVFCASSDVAMKEMRKACFDYLRLGGFFSDGPVALLSGLKPQPSSLVMHFFFVAFFGVGRLLLPFPTFTNLWIGFRLVKGAASIIFPIIRAEGVLQMFFPRVILSYYNSPPLKEI